MKKRTIINLIVSSLVATFTATVFVVGLTFGWFNTNISTGGSGDDIGLSSPLIKVDIVQSDAEYESGAVYEWKENDQSIRLSNLSPRQKNYIIARVTNRTQNTVKLESVTLGMQSEEPKIETIDGQTRYYYLGTQIRLNSVKVKETSTTVSVADGANGAYLVETEFSSTANYLPPVYVTSPLTAQPQQLLNAFELAGAETVYVELCTEFVDSRQNQNAYKDFDSNACKRTINFAVNNS